MVTRCWASAPSSEGGARCELTGWYHNHSWTVGAVSEFGKSAGHPPDDGRRGKALLRRERIETRTFQCDELCCLLFDFCDPLQTRPWTDDLTTLRLRRKNDNREGNDFRNVNDPQRTLTTGVIAPQKANNTWHFLHGKLYSLAVTLARCRT
jgi:hypothetical protein